MMICAPRLSMCSLALAHFKPSRWRAGFGWRGGIFSNNGTVGCFCFVESGRPDLGE